MTTASFDRDKMARRYAKEFFQMDVGLVGAHYLTDGAADREVRLVFVTELMPIRESDPFDPMRVGQNPGRADEHSLVLLDVTPSQWRLIVAGELPLPAGWSLADKVSYTRASLARKSRRAKP